MGNIGIWELLLILAIGLLLFGSGKITTIMKDFGQGIKEFKKAVKEDDEKEKPIKKPTSKPVVKKTKTTKKK